MELALHFVEKGEDLLQWQEKLGNFYNTVDCLINTTNNYLADKKENRVGVVTLGPWAILFLEGPDELIEGNTDRIPFLLWDDMINYNEMLQNASSDKVFVVQDSCPVAFLDFTKETLDRWITKIKVANTYKLGARYKQLTTDYYTFDNYDQMMEMMALSFERKKKTYPWFDPINDYYLLNAYYNNPQWTRIISWDNDKMVQTGLGFIYERTFYYPYIEVTSDEEIKRKHRAYVVGHIKAAKFADSRGCNQVNMGIYLPYKDILACQIVNFPGIRYIK